MPQREFEGWGRRIVKFLSEVSIGGMRFIVADESTTMRRVIWGFMVMFGFGFMGFHMFKQALFYWSYPSSTTVEINYGPTINREGLTFPVITICNQNMVSKMSVQSIDVPPAAILHMFPFEETKFEDHKVTPEEKALFDQIMLMGNQLAGDTEESQKEFYYSMSESMDTTLYQCLFDGQNCRKDFKKVYTSSGSCYQFNSDGLKKQVKAGAMYGLKLYLVINQTDYLANPTGSAGFQVFMHSPTDVPEMENKAMQVSPGKHTKFSIKKTQIKTMPPPHGHCGERYLSMYEDYSLSRCEEECLANRTFQLCNCVPLFHPHKRKNGETLKLCGPSTYNCYEEALDDMIKSDNSLDDCKCKLECLQTIYDSEMTSASLSEFFAHVSAEQLSAEVGMDIPSDVIMKNYMKVDIFYKQLSYIDVTQQEAYSIFQLFCDFGGAMSLILGSTFLTCFEFVDFAIFTMWLQENTPRKKRVKPLKGKNISVHQRLPRQTTTPWATQTAFHPT